MRRLLQMLAAMLLVTTSAPAWAKPAKIKTETAWYEFKFLGNKVGFMYAKDEPTTVEGKPAVHVHRWSVLTVRRQSETIRMESTTDAWFEPDGTPIRFEHRRKEGGEERKVAGHREGNLMKIQRIIGDNKIDAPPVKMAPGVVFASSLEWLFTKSPLKPKKKLSGKALEEAEGHLRDFSLRVKGKKGSRYIVEEKLGEVTTLARMTRSGKLERAELVGLGAVFERTTKAKAIKMGDIVDIFSSALFRIPYALPNGNELERVVVLLRGRSGRRPHYLTDAQQKAKKRGKDSVALTINVGSPPRANIKLPLKSKKEFLAATPYEPTSDERLVAKARALVAGKPDLWSAARAINAFVYQHIKDKTLAHAFLSAVEAYENRAGDCTEHAVLFSALAKIVGIPTRLATGLVYVGGPENVFGYHEWVEIWTGKKWLAMDPTFGQDIADPTHIKFAAGQSDADGLERAGIVAAGLIGDLELEVLMYRTNGGVDVTP